jgi:chromosome segregation ATPase
MSNNATTGLAGAHMAAKIAELEQLLRMHQQCTGSAAARRQDMQQAQQELATYSCCIDNLQERLDMLSFDMENGSMIIQSIRAKLDEMYAQMLELQELKDRMEAQFDEKKRKYQEAKDGFVREMTLLDNVELQMTENKKMLAALAERSAAAGTAATATNGAPLQDNGR